MNISRLQPLIQSGQPTWMVNPGGSSPDAVDMLADAGAKCIFIDCERTAVGIESVSALVRCAHSRGLTAMLRTESMQPEIMIRYLDRGIDGLIVPHTETVEQLRQIKDVISYVTKGRRERVFAIAQIESIAAVDNITALAADDSVDGFLIGPNDLSHSMGFAGDTSRAELALAIEGVVKALQARGRVWGLPGAPATSAQWVAKGASFFYCTLEQIIKLGYVDLTNANRS